MAAPTKLTAEEVQRALAAMPGWTLHDDKLFREYTFPDFVHAFGFMATAALRIEVLNHHPEWCNVYHKVKVHLTTHDAGGISAKDVELAKVLDEVAARLQ
ncbi:MAG: 4a-hydroxytetrahydrobiopterin dehydratase [Bryobacterales bacterium]|nr:4a-hydroxytetrahydrobiopterin dehydratase [Bryobacterales bacterium]